MKYASRLAPQMEMFIQHRTASMRWCRSYDANLHAFDTFCIKQYPNAATLTDEIVSEWCARRETECRNSCRSRIYCLIDFVHYLNKWHNANLTEVSPPKREKRKYVPHAYTQEELVKFFSECDKGYVNANRPDSQRLNLIISVVFRLLYSTGMRTFEARMLRRKDVNLDNGVIGIIVSKGYDERYIVLHDTMLKLALQYDQLMEGICPSRTFFFPDGKDGCITQKWLDAAFRKLWDRANGVYCRLYDFRHNYATQNINSWLSSGLSFEPKMLYLSKSMGHRDLESTKYYYSLVPALSELLEQQTRASFDEIIPEVQDEESN